LRLDSKSKAYLTAVSIVGVAILAVSAPLLPFQDWQGMLLLAVLCGIAQMMPVSLFRSSSISVSAGITFAGLLLYGPMAAIWINMGSAVVVAFRPKWKPIHKVIFNAGNHALAAGVAGVVYVGVGGVKVPESLALSVIPILLAAVCYFLVQTLVVSGIIALTERVPLLPTWDANFRGTALNFIGLAIISTTIASAGRSAGPIGIIIFSVPLVMAWYTFKHIQGRMVYPQPEFASKADQR